MYTLLINVFFYACESPDKNILDTATVEDEPLNCPTGVYPALLQVWNGEEQDNLVDTPPFCEDLFDIELQNEGVLREMKARKHFEKPSEKRVREKAEAVRRVRKLARKRAQIEGLIPTKKRPPRN